MALVQANSLLAPLHGKFFIEREKHLLYPRSSSTHSYFDSHLVFRPFSADLKLLADHIYDFAKQYVNDPSVPIYRFNSVNGLGYTDKRRIHAHRDNLWSNDGKFSHHLNSQLENSYSVILVCGDPRELKFHLIEAKKKQSKVDSVAALQTFSFKHGTLFFLHPRDEASVCREFFEDHGVTFFKHSSTGVINNGEMSLGLVFRTVCHSHEVDKLTGQLVSGRDATTQQVFDECEDKIHAYMQSEQRQLDEDKMKRKWFNCKHTHFKTKNI